MGITAKAQAAYLALPAEVRRELLKCREADQAFRVLDRMTDLPEDVKCDLAGTLPISAPDLCYCGGRDSGGAGGHERGAVGCRHCRRHATNTAATGAAAREEE